MHWVGGCKLLERLSGCGFIYTKKSSTMSIGNHKRANSSLSYHIIDVVTQMTCTRFTVPLSLAKSENVK